MVLPRGRYPARCLLHLVGDTTPWRTHPAEELCVYRDEPKIFDDNKYGVDTGWRISCRRRIKGEGDVQGNEVYPDLLCRALDIDDSWVHLLDKPGGTAFKKNPVTGLFEEIKAPQSGLTENRSEDWWQIRC